MSTENPFITEGVNEFCKVPELTWVVLNKRSCLLSAGSWGGGYYERYSNFPQLNELISEAGIWKNHTFSVGIVETAHKIVEFTKIMQDLFSAIEDLRANPDTLQVVISNFQSTSATANSIVQKTEESLQRINRFEELNDSAERSIQFISVDSSDLYYFDVLGPNPQEVSLAFGSIKGIWSTLNSELEYALSELTKSPVSALAGILAKIRVETATKFWINVATDTSAFIEKTSQQQKYLNGEYLYDKAPIQEGVGYYIGFLTAYGIKVLYAGDRVQDVSGGGYSYHLGVTTIGNSGPIANGGGQWFFIKAGGYGCYRITNGRIGPSYSLDVFGGSMMPVLLPTGSYTGQYWRFYGDRLANTYIKNQGWLSLVGSAVAMGKAGDSNLGFSTSASFAVLLPPVQTDILYETTPLATRVGDFGAVYAQADPGGGIGGYDLRNGSDRGFAFDYDSSGKCDHLVFYRPGAGTVYILQNRFYGSFVARYAQGGIGGYNLMSPSDRGFAFDYDGSGKLDHLVFYRPGRGAIFIVKNNRNGSFSPVYAQGDPGNGIGTYNLMSPDDRGFAFDYDGSGKLDHLVFYRPGRGAIFIVKNNRDGTFAPVYAQGDPGNGIGGYNLLSPDDRGFAFDYDGSGKLDHLVFYRPGRGAIFILKNNRNGSFSPVYAQGDPGSGIGTYNLLSPDDRGFAFDYDGSGKLDHLVFYRPGRGAVFILKNNRNGSFTPVYAQGDPGSGLGGYNLADAGDRGFAYDYDGSGKLDHLTFYRPGHGAIYINQHLS